MNPYFSLLVDELCKIDVKQLNPDRSEGSVMAGDMTDILAKNRTLCRLAIGHSPNWAAADSDTTPDDLFEGVDGVEDAVVRIAWHTILADLYTVFSVNGEFKFNKGKIEEFYSL